MSETKVNDIKKVIDSLMGIVHSSDGESTKTIMIVNSIKVYDRVVRLANREGLITDDEERELDRYLEHVLFQILHYHYGSTQWWEG